jgi:hypothetical protein
LTSTPVSTSVPPLAHGPLAPTKETSATSDVAPGIPAEPDGPCGPGGKSMMVQRLSTHATSVLDVLA